MFHTIFFQEDWQMLKKTAKAQHYPRNSMAELWQLIVQYHKEQFPTLITLVSLALTHLIHTADCERAFSSQNIVTSSLRNRISADNCDQLMKVMIEGSPLKEFNYLKALKIWRESKSRVIFQKKPSATASIDNSN